MIAFGGTSARETKRIEREIGPSAARPAGPERQPAAPLVR
jgi:hypothetical protein